MGLNMCRGLFMRGRGFGGPPPLCRHVKKNALESGGAKFGEETSQRIAAAQVGSKHSLGGMRFGEENLFGFLCVYAGVRF